MIHMPSIFNNSMVIVIIKCSIKTRKKSGFYILFFRDLFVSIEI